MNTQPAAIAQPLSTQPPPAQPLPAQASRAQASRAQASSAPAAPYVPDRVRQTDVVDGWTITGWLGAAMTAAGCAHAVPLWLPLQLRDPDVAVAIATQAAGAYPMLLLGLFVLVATAAGRARWRPLAILGGSLLALAIVVLGSTLVYAAAASGAMHDLASGEPAALASFRVVMARTLWFHGVTGVSAVAGGVVAVELARHYRLRQRV